MKIAAMKLIRDATREINARRLLFINRFGETRMFIVMTLLLLVQEKGDMIMRSIPSAAKNIAISPTDINNR